MTKTILFATQTPQSTHPALGPVFEVTFTDNTTLKMYAETFLDQISVTGTWDFGPLEGHKINIDEAYVY